MKEYKKFFFSARRKLKNNICIFCNNKNLKFIPIKRKFEDFHTKCEKCQNIFGYILPSSQKKITCFYIKIKDYELGFYYPAPGFNNYLYLELEDGNIIDFPYFKFKLKELDKLYNKIKLILILG